MDTIARIYCRRIIKFQFGDFPDILRDIRQAQFIESGLGIPENIEQFSDIGTDRGDC